MTEPVWLRIARGYLGQREIVGRKHNPLILRWWQRIRAPFTDDETPWCAGFVGGVLEEAGIKSSRSAAARSYELGLAPAEAGRRLHCRARTRPRARARLLPARPGRSRQPRRHRRQSGQQGLDRELRSETRHRDRLAEGRPCPAADPARPRLKWRRVLERGLRRNPFRRSAPHSASVSGVRLCSFPLVLTSAQRPAALGRQGRPLC